MRYAHFPVKTPFLVTLAAYLLSVTLIAQTEDPHATGNVPITFYGKVVDQNNQPVSDVKVQLDILVGYLTSPTTGKQRLDNVSLVTDKDGRFVLDNIRGGSIQFNLIEKNGYKLSPKQVKANFIYYPKQFHVDQENPVVFRMWKAAGKEVLAGSHWHGKVACDGTLVRFGLLTGEPSKDGDLEIACTLTSTDKKVGKRVLSDYGFQIRVGGGGIQATRDEFTYMAPESGYLPTVTIDEKAADANHRNPELKQEFYIKTADGHYGRLSIDWSAWQKSPTYFEWDCSINPSGSRNLER